MMSEQYLSNVIDLWDELCRFYIKGPAYNLTEKEKNVFEKMRMWEMRISETGVDSYYDEF